MKRSFGIDFIRTLSIALVIFRHYGFYKGFNLGYFAIEFLFVISGFLIGQILFTDFFSTPQIERASLRRFMIRRWFRILPLYYFCLFFKFILAPSIGLNILYYVFFLQNHFYGITFYPETWTLVIDEWFYLGVPLGLFLFIRFVSTRPRSIFLFVLGIIVVINVLRYLWVLHSNTAWEGLTGNVPLRQDTLLFGVLLAFLKNKYNSVFRKMDSLPFFLGGLVLLSIYIFAIYKIRFPIDHINNYIWTRTISFGLLSMFVMFTLPYFENSFPMAKAVWLKPWNSFIIWGSKLSYALYLVHNEVNILLFKTLYIEGTNPLWTKSLLILITILVSFGLYKFLEKPMLILRDKYFPDRPMQKISAS
ncbi:MAG TPA: acyltransferase [Bacteroidia bacterium]|nr:acyltransferase [Bacteroidia bacterium]